VLVNSLFPSHDRGGPEVWAAWEATDSTGRVHGRSRRKWTNEAAAQTDLDNFDFLPELRELEKQAVYEHIASGNSPDTFVRTDLTVPGFETYILRTFARSRIKDEYDFMVNAAPWVAARNPTGGGPASIKNRLGISDERAQNIHDRAEHIELTTGPALAQDDADINLDIEAR